MAEIIRGTTPTIQYKFNTVNPANLVAAVLTIKKNGVVAVGRELDTATVTEHAVAWTLTQAETLVVSGYAKVMCNWKLADGTRGASKEIEVQFLENHINEVI